MKKALKFINKTDEAFTQKFNGEMFSFEAGESKLLPDYLAMFMAKKLATREAFKQKREDLVDEQIEAIAGSYIVAGEVVEGESDLKLEIEMMNEEIVDPVAKKEEKELLQEECEIKGVKYDKRWGVDKLKEALAEAGKSKETEKVNDDQTFEGLNE
jgi:hypothetical protein